jgi:hypothetical protein
MTMATGNQLQGAWKLLSFHLTLASDPSTSVIEPLGPLPLGRIVFTPESYMACILTSAEAASPITSESWIKATDDEILRVARAMATYCGPYKLIPEGDEALLSTDVDIALDPNWIGGPQVRRWAIQENGGKTILTLRPVQQFELPVR